MKEEKSGLYEDGVSNSIPKDMWIKWNKITMPFKRASEKMRKRKELAEKIEKSSKS